MQNINKTSTYPVIIACALLVVLTGCSNPQLQPFTSDGCSLFPDRSPIDERDWRDCCVQHDIAYWQGGTAEMRKDADIVLRQCVLEKSGDATLAELMYNGVRLGGGPYFPNWYRWGYGWPFDRQYQPLTDDEKQQVQKLLQDYFDDSSGES